MANTGRAAIALATVLCIGGVAWGQNRDQPGLVHLGDGEWGTVAEAETAGLFLYRGRWLPTKLKKKLAKWEKEDAKGLDWDDAYRADTKYYRVTTNVPRFIVELDIKPFLDELYDTYVEIFKDDFGLKGKAAKNRWINIYDGFETYAAEARGPGGRPTRMTPGFIQSGDELFVFYEETDPARFYATVFHEGAHQFFQAMLPGADLPIWLGEALATYFEGCTYSRATGKITPGFLPPVRLEHAQMQLKRAKPAAGLAEKLFMNVSRASFQANHYALSWSFVYYLIHRPDPKARKKFAGFLKEINGSGTKPVEAVFHKATKEDLEQVQEGWRDFVLGLARPTDQVHWVGLRVSGAAASEDLRTGDMVWSFDGVEVYSVEQLQSLWEARPRDRTYDVVVVRWTPSPTSPNAKNELVTATIQAGSEIQLDIGGFLTRSGNLRD